MPEFSLWERLCSLDPEVRDEAVVEYREWANHPTTRAMLLLIRQMIDAYLDAPVPPDALAGNTITSEQRMWKLHGMREIQRRLDDMEDDARAVRSNLALEQANNDLQPHNPDNL